MVQTRSAARRIALGSGSIIDSAPQKDVSSDNSVSKPTKKARREDMVAPKKRRRAKPGELCQLNLDVLFLIAAYIHPVDLLNLARTCKSLRELLMDKSSAFVWKTARQQAKGLPECPADLTEPEYANLVFYARCHGCDKYTTTVFWNIRRRYCPNCRVRRLRRLSNCAEVIRTNKTVLPVEHIVVKDEYNIWCDRDQVTSFMHEYRQASDKKRFISERQSQCHTIQEHARKCADRQAKRVLEHKKDQRERRQERKTRIFHLLEQHGYGPEIAYVGHLGIENCRKSDFKTSKPLTNNEWNRIWPEWLKLLNDIRSLRIEDRVFQPRLRSLRFAYDRYVTQPSPDASTLDLLPHMTDLVRFPPFRNILKAPEEFTVDEKSFLSAFDQLPSLVAEWRKDLDAEVAELVQIPSQLSQNASNSRNPGKKTRAESSNVNQNKLGLACALFETQCTGVLPHPRVFLFCTPRDTHIKGDDLDRLECPRLSLEQYDGIKFFEEAPYIVHACGLDPNMATMEDMDRRNARLRCLCCRDKPNVVVGWRNAMRHARLYHTADELPRLSESPRWQLVDDEHIDAIQAVGQSRTIWNEWEPFDTFRCLLCKPRVCQNVCGAQSFASHLYSCHSLGTQGESIERVRCELVGVWDSRLVVPQMDGRRQFKFKVWEEECK